MLPGGQYAAGLIILLSTRILTDITDRTDLVLCAIRQKHQKPLAVDARCLLRAIDAAAV